MKKIFTLIALAVLAVAQSYAVKTVPMTQEMFCEWDNYTAGANVVNKNAGAYDLGVSTGLPYGHGSVLGSCYADLSDYEALILNVTDGTPRMLWNRQDMGGSSPDFLEVNNASSPYVKSVEGTVWTIDLAKIVAEKGYAHLNCIKGANWNNTTITSMELVLPKPTLVHDFNYDVTNTYMVNANLVDGVTGWTTKGAFGATQKQALTGGAAEAYAGWGSLDLTEYGITQTIVLPKGKYMLENGSFFRQGVGFDTDPSKSLAYLKAGDKQVAIKTLGSVKCINYANSQPEGAGVFSSGMYKNQLVFDVEEDGTEVEVGVVGTFDLKQSWCIVGEFKLYNLDAVQTTVDMTSSIVNNSFENGTEGWTIEGEWNEQYNGEAVQMGTRYVEKWQPSGGLPDGMIYQTINVPNGSYTLTASALAKGTGTYVFANDARIEAPETASIVSLDVDVTDGTLTIGYVRDNTTANWVAVDNFQLVRHGMLENTLLTADNYSVTGTVALADGVDASKVPAEFLGYIGEYNASADLAGDNIELIFWSNTEEGLLDSYSIKGDALQYDDTKFFELKGKKFQVRGINGEATGELKITQIDETHFAMEPCCIYYRGNAIATINNFVIFYDPTAVAEVEAAEAVAPAVKKYVKGGKLIIVKDGNEYNAAGAQVK